MSFPLILCLCIFPEAKSANKGYERKGRACRRSISGAAQLFLKGKKETRPTGKETPSLKFSVSGGGQVEDAVVVVVVVVVSVVSSD